jgi:hypothetical protein
MLTVLPGLDDFVEGGNNDDALSPAPGLSADGSNAVVLTTVGHSTNGVESPPALAAPLGPPANLSNLLGDNNASGAGHSSIDGIPVGNSATDNNGALGSPANGSVAPPAPITTPITFLGSDAPPALTTALCPLADANSLSEGHNTMD